MIIGFTGTQQGLTVTQRDMLVYTLTTLKGLGATELHHGDCVGADAEAHQIARELGYCIVIHPPTNSNRVAGCEGDERLPPKPYLERNHDVGDICNILVGCSATHDEVLRSGTWATIRYAKKVKKQVLIIYPNGTVTSHVSK